MSHNRDESQELSHNRENNGPDLRTPSTALTYAVGAGTELGKKRWHNEDSFLAISSTGNTSHGALPFGLFVVANGTGGHDDGQEASCSAAQAIDDFLLPNLVRNDTLHPEACIALLAEAVQKANEAVSQQNIELNNNKNRPMPQRVIHVITTLTAAMFVDSTAYIANVGDCRTYHYRASEGLRRITTDHTLAALWLKDGVYGVRSPEDLYTHPKRHVTYRALPTLPPVEVDLFMVPLQPGDVVLLCSSGLWRMVRDPVIEGVLHSTPADPSQMTKALIQLALSAGGWDNISVIVVSVREEPRQIFSPDLRVFASPYRLHLPQV